MQHGRELMNLPDRFRVRGTESMVPVYGIGLTSARELALKWKLVKRFWVFVAEEGKTN